MTGAVFCVECGGRMPNPSADFFASNMQSAPASKGPASKRPLETQRRVLGATVNMAAPAPSSISEALADASKSTAPKTQRGSPTVQGMPAARAGAPPPQPAAAGAPASKGPRKGRRSSAPPPPHVAAALDDIDQSFNAILASPTGASTSLTAADMAEAQGLFKEIAASYLAPLRDLMIELELGDPGKDWFTLVAPSVTSLKRSAEGMHMLDVSAALGELDTALKACATGSGTSIAPEARSELEKHYRALVGLLPDAFAVESERDRREPVIVQGLLRQVPEVRQVALDKLFAAGLTRLEMFYKASADEIAATTGLAHDVAQKILDRFQRYRRETGSIPPGPNRAGEHAKLKEHTLKLERQNTAFESASGADKRKIRQERESTLVEVNLLLARLGAVDLVERLERAAFQRKVEELKAYLAEQK
ncbi:MAG TPA: hypothetical protein VGM29_08100 [Polyangiaceae bacterium]|jgi:hypothetical protein